MNGLLGKVAGIFLSLTPNGRNKKVGKAPIQKTGAFMLILGITIIMAIILLYPVFDIDLKSYCFYALIIGTTIFIVFYIITVNVVYNMTTKILKNQIEKQKN